MLNEFNRIFAVSIDMKNLETVYDSKAIFTSVDKNTSTILIELKKDGVPMKLANKTIYAIIECIDKQMYKQDVVILEEKDGAVALDLKTDVLQEGINRFRLHLFDNGDIMVSPMISYKVVKILEDSVDATDERVSILDQLISEVDNVKLESDKILDDLENKINNTVSDLEVTDQDITDIMDMVGL